MRDHETRGLSKLQRQLLARITRRECEEGVAVSEIRQGLDSSTVSRALRRLEERRLINRLMVSRRKTLIFLTPEARTIGKDAAAGEVQGMPENL